MTEARPLRTLLRTLKGKKPEHLLSAHKPGLVPYIDIAAVEHGSKRQFADPREGRLVPAGTLVMVWDGARSGWTGVTSFEGALGSTLVALESPLEKRYLAAFLRSRFRELNSNTRGTGIPHVNPDYLSALQIPMLSKDDQLAIAQLMETVAERVASSRDHMEKARQFLNRFRQAVYAAAASGRLTAAWRAARPRADATSLVQRLESTRIELLGMRGKPPLPIAEGDLPDIPETWSWLSVDSLSRAVVDGVHKTPTYVDQGIPFLTVRNLTAGPGISFENCRYIRKQDHEAFTARTKPQRGDILISKDGTIGVTRAVRTDQEFSIFVSVAMVKPLLYEMSDYLELALSSPQLQQQMVGVGSGLVHLVLRDLKADAIPVPPLEEQVEIVERVNRLLKIADQVQDRVELANVLTERSWQALMTKAFRVELDLSGVDQSSSDADAARAV
jgi:type I restriction enzyme S subunit